MHPATNAIAALSSSCAGPSEPEAICPSDDAAAKPAYELVSKPAAPTWKRPPRSRLEAKTQIAVCSKSASCSHRRKTASHTKIPIVPNGRRPHSGLDGITPDHAYFTPLPLRLAALAPVRGSTNRSRKNCSDNSTQL